MGTQTIPRKERVGLVTYERRIKILQVSPVFLLDFFKAGRHPAYEVGNPLPDDVALVAYKPDAQTGTVNLYLHSDTWPELEEGFIPETLPPPYGISLTSSK